MRLIKYVILAAILIVLVSLALANRTPVTLRLMPDDIAETLQVAPSLNVLTLDLWQVILMGIVLGVLLGYLAEFLRERKFRADRRALRREAKRMSTEITTLKADKAKGDDVLALLEEQSGSR